LNFAGGGGIGISVLFPSQAILKPFIYLTSTPGKDVRTKLIQAFKLQPLAQRPYRQTWAHLMYDDRTPLISIEMISKMILN
jgi:hypothetical protein